MNPVGISENFDLENISKKFSIFLPVFFYIFITAIIKELIGVIFLAFSIIISAFYINIKDRVKRNLGLDTGTKLALKMRRWNVYPFLVDIFLMWLADINLLFAFFFSIYFTYKVFYGSFEVLLFSLLFSSLFGVTVLYKIIMIIINKKRISKISKMIKKPEK